MTKRESRTQWAEAAERYAEQCAERGDWFGAARFAGEAAELQIRAEATDPTEECDPWPTCS